MTRFLLWIGTYCTSCVVQQTSGVKDLSLLVRYDDGCLAAIRHVQSIIPVVQPRQKYTLPQRLVSLGVNYAIYCFNAVSDNDKCELMIHDK